MDGVVIVRAFGVGWDLVMRGGVLPFQELMSCHRVDDMLEIFHLDFSIANGGYGV